jgi:TPR repeat protein
MDKLTLPPIHALKLAYKLRNAEAKEPPEPKSNSRELIMRLVSVARQKGFETAERRLTEILTELGDMSAFVRLGEIYADGIGGVSDPKAAQTALEYAAMHGESAAYKKLGDFYLSGKFGEKNSALALSCYERAAELGEKNAYHLMADMYLGGDSIARDVARAAELYKMAELGGDGEAAKKFSAIDKRRSELYERGAAAAAAGAADEAFSLFTLASAMGHTAAPLALARAYLIGMGTKIDRRKAYRILREAVDKNTPEAYFPLALCYSRGVGVRMDYKTALSLLSDANARGDERAVTEARKIRKRVEMKFARQAYSRAIRLLFCGKQEAAKSELEYACELGHARSVYTLGTFYEFGFGTPCDRERAYELYEKAYDGGFTDKRNNYKLDMLKTSRGKKR